MSVRTPFTRARGWAAGILAAAGVFSSIAVSASAAERPLFPAPLHITRELTDPVSQTRTVVDEYCHGSRVVAVSGHNTSIADFEKGEVTSIDFEAGTYSVTKFEAIAKLHARTATVSANATAARPADWKVNRRGAMSVASRNGEGVDLERADPAQRQQIHLTIDTQLTLSRPAVEALLGTGYPNRRDDTADAIMSALRADRRTAAVTTNAATAQQDGEYRLPLEYVSRFDVGGETIEVRNTVMRVGNELAPPEVLAIPPGAKLVDSSVVAAQRELDELDGKPTSRNP
ncbi:MAG: hypothetical protein M3Q69_06630 [Acidobacteriota bacterium]|nr:hypothetical protein [Acidobacteriota bacterium]